MFVCECLAVSAWPSPSRIGGASLLSVTYIYMGYYELRRWRRTAAVGWPPNTAKRAPALAKSRNGCTRL